MCTAYLLGQRKHLPCRLLAKMAVLLSQRGHRFWLKVDHDRVKLVGVQLRDGRHADVEHTCQVIGDNFLHGLHAGAVEMGAILASLDELASVNALRHVGHANKVVVFPCNRRQDTIISITTLGSE